MKQHLIIGLSALALLAGCNDLGGLAGGIGGIAGGGGPTVTGSVKEMKGASIRVGLVGASKAGGKVQEIASSTAGNGTFALVLPASPPIQLMEQPDETRSIVFSLRAYDDRNGNNRYDDSEPLCECSSGQFRYYASAGPEGSYFAGWNLITNDGRFSQSFNTAFAL